MIRLLESLPEVLSVGGKEYPIYTDFADWIRFEQMLFDEELKDQEKSLLMLSWYRDEIPPDFQEAIRQIIWFYRGGVPEEESSSGKSGAGRYNAIYDFEEDAEVIFSSFLDAYGINLSRLEYGTLHWWEFRALLLGLPERTRLAKIMGWRAADTKGLSPQEKKIKQFYELKRNGRGYPRSLQEREQEMIARARDARRRADTENQDKVTRQ